MTEAAWATASTRTRPGAWPAPIEDQGIDDLWDVALGWTGIYLNTFEREIHDRQAYLASSGPVLTAVGAMGQVSAAGSPRSARGRLPGVHRIHDAARGLPRAVNNLATQALVAAYADRKAIVDEASTRIAVTEVTSD
jgi:hypothetical protein